MVLVFRRERPVKQQRVRILPERHDQAVTQLPDMREGYLEGAAGRFRHTPVAAERDDRFAGIE